MEPRKELKKKTQSCSDGSKRHFQIVKLEERVAPGCHFNPNAGPRTSFYGEQFKYGKYVGKC